MGKYVLKVLSGVAQKKIFNIKDGLLIGRTQGDIILKDSLVSSKHAKIYISDNQVPLLVDQDSKNKILVNNKEHDELILQDGTQFSIGKTQFKVAFVLEPQELFINFMKKQLPSVKDTSLPLQAFKKPISLVFLSGLQKGQKYYISYGPRYFGSHFIDCPLLDEQAPKTAFAIIPEKESCIFMTKQQKIVMFNGTNTTKSLIKNKDYVLIGDTKLQFLL